MKKHNDDLELIIDLIQGAFEEEGYRTVRFADSDIYSTTSYDCVVLQDHSGREYRLTIDESLSYNTEVNKWERTNIIDGIKGGA
jgi:hypothetical protein